MIKDIEKCTECGEPIKPEKIYPHQGFKITHCEKCGTPFALRDRDEEWKKLS